MEYQNWMLKLMNKSEKVLFVVRVKAILIYCYSSNRYNNINSILSNNDYNDKSKDWDLN